MAPDAKKGETAMWEQIRIGDLDGKRVLVTGGSTGIGAAVAAALAAQGARVAVHYNESGAAAQAVQAQAPERIVLVQGDMGSGGTAQRATIPMGREGTAEECVGAFLFLASGILSGYVTGQVIEVNGGQLLP